MKTEIVLTPVQQDVLNGLLEGSKVGRVLVLRGEPGHGMTTILEKFQSAKGGAIIGVREFLAGPAARLTAIEEALLRMIEDAMHAHDLVMVDDLHLVTNMVERHNHPRRYLLDAALTALLAEARVLHKTLIFATRGDVPWSIERRACIWEIRKSPRQTRSRSAALISPAGCR
jgi:hypothetical protein